MTTHITTKLMRLRFSYLRLIELFLFSVCIGCASPDIAVIDVESGKCHYPEHADRRQFLCLVDRERGQFVTIRENGSDQILRTYGVTGELVLQKRIPRFPRNGRCYAFSKNGKKVVYFDNSTGGFRLRNISDSDDAPLGQVLAKSDYQIPFVSWTSNDEIIAVIRNSEKVGGKGSLIISIDVKTGDKKDIYKPNKPKSFDYSLSPNGQYLAFADELEDSDVIKVIDLHRGSLSAVLGTRDNIVGCPSWHPKSDQLAYIDGDNIKIWKTSKKAGRAIYSVSKEKTIYQLTFGDAFVACEIGDSSSDLNTLLILDSDDGRELRTIKEDVNGKLMSFAGETVIAEIGY